MASSAAPSSPRDALAELWLRRDLRLDGWFMMDSPIPTLIFSALYLLFVTIVGPRIMRDRAPLHLKGPMQVYNVTQVGKGILYPIP